ncbi:MAG: hypothetical protein A3G25_13905 [Betaproteobacteria bacterium RIFCSPLOWO2_12_FULL_63_13]|nr:MAG: hypothetical protein A3G25_13905 [Betaproteobacteria bacterium RIFCSPLOWO2_12_FULL_63_13]
MYGIVEFGVMVDDSVRMRAYRQALALSIKPGSTVLDLGTGTGVMAMLACKHGAERVYAVEPSDVIQIARETAAANGLGERIVFIKEISTRVALPERVDLIIEDVRGGLPWLGTHIPDIVDARRRMLAPSGRIISTNDTVFCAVVELEDFYGKLTRPWRTPLEGLDLSAGERYVLNAYHRIHPGADRLLTHPYAWAKLDYMTIESSVALGDFRLEIERDGVGHGILLWFDGELIPGVKICNAPGQPQTPYEPLFFPWPKPVALRGGESVEIGLRGDLHGVKYVWTWSARFGLPGANGAPPLGFRQSTFLGLPLAVETIAGYAPDTRPILSDSGHHARFVLGCMDGNMALEEIAAQLVARFRGHFPRMQDALEFASNLSAKYRK